MIMQKYNSLVTVTQLFETELAKFAGHILRVKHQYAEIRKARQNLQPGEVAIHIDFSENFTCKSGTEVQASHFGHQPQIMIHQGMFYAHVSELPLHLPNIYLYAMHVI